MLETIRKIENFSPRKGKNEIKIAKFLENEMEKYCNNVEIQEFNNEIPIGDSTLIVDGESIECESTSLVPGEFEDKCIISSVHISSRIFREPNINFNPYCEEISLATFYFAPSVAIKREDVCKVVNSESVYCKISLKKEKFKTRNILVGNLVKPKHIIFAHYDSIKSGAIDNASGTALCLELIKRFPNIIKDNLVIFSGSEELSFDYPIYWGKGYRIFEEEYGKLLNECKSILVIDCVGFAKPCLMKDYLISAFPIKNLEKFKSKICLLSCEKDKFSRLWSVYHSEKDSVDNLNEDLLESAMEKLIFYLYSS